jgi:hypothetical protein
MEDVVNLISESPADPLSPYRLALAHSTGSTTYIVMYPHWQMPPRAFVFM